MKKALIVVVIIVIVIAGYLGRHKIKAMLGGSSSQPLSNTMSPSKSLTVSPTSSAAPSNNIYMVKNDSSKGNYLTDFQGMTLYVFDKDTQGVSNCNGGCAAMWPPYTSGATAQGQFPAHVTVITRSDGTKQFVWDGKPLYYYGSDKKAGDVLGDGVGGVWHIVKQ